MSIQSITSPPLPLATPTSPLSPQLATSQTSFSQVLAQATHLPARTDADAARDAAERFVAATLVNPILTQLRESNEAAAPFAPSSAEKQFRALLDAELAQRITGAAHFPLVDRLAHDLLSRTQANTSPEVPPTPPAAPGRITP